MASLLFSAHPCSQRLNKKGPTGGLLETITKKPGLLKSSPGIQARAPASLLLLLQGFIHFLQSVIPKILGGSCLLYGSAYFFYGSLCRLVG